MEFKKDMEECLGELQEEWKTFTESGDPEAEVDALKEMLELFMRGTTSVREKIDRYNDRRYRHG